MRRLRLERETGTGRYLAFCASVSSYRMLRADVRERALAEVGGCSTRAEGVSSCAT